MAWQNTNILSEEIYNNDYTDTWYGSDCGYQKKYKGVKVIVMYTFHNAVLKDFLVNIAMLFNYKALVYNRIKEL